jgi:hypothetical protein
LDTTGEPNNGGDIEPYVSFTGQTFSGTKPFWNDNADSPGITSFIVEWEFDTDRDGLPDYWEKQYGFEPDNPSDAKSDPDNDGFDNQTEFKAGTDPKDLTKPSLVSASAAGDFKTVTLTFSEAVEAGSATNLANYAFSPNLAVTAAAVKKNVVTLTTAAQTPGAVAYTVTVNNVVDTSKNVIAANSTASFYSFMNLKDGVLKFSFWGGINGTQVDNLYQDPRWPASPDMTAAIFAFNSRDALPNDSRAATASSSTRMTPRSSLSAPMTRRPTWPRSPRRLAAATSSPSLTAPGLPSPSH